MIPRVTHTSTNFVSRALGPGVGRRGFPPSHASKSAPLLPPKPLPPVRGRGQRHLSLHAARRLLPTACRTGRNAVRVKRPRAGLDDTHQCGVGRPVSEGECSLEIERQGERVRVYCLPLRSCFSPPTAPRLSSPRRKAGAKQVTNRPPQPHQLP